MAVNKSSVRPLPIVQLISRYWHTVRYLKWIQVFGRIQNNFKYTKADLKPIGDLRKSTPHWVYPARSNQRMFGEVTFCFLNDTHILTKNSDWNNDQWSKLWLYNLHYFDDLTAINADKRVDWHCRLIQRWIDENPPGIGNGWEPYPLSLRIVNWVKWGFSGYTIEDDWIHSLAVQVRFLCQNIETHLLGNHLFANAKALMFAGLFFECDEACEWYQIGLKLIGRGLPEQVLEDGGNFELSTIYHLIFLEDLLDLVNIHRAYDHTLPEGVEMFIPPMLQWLDAMCHPDGEISFFNDSALGVTPSVTEIKNYGVRLGFLLSDAEKYTGLTDLPGSGYSRVEMGDAVALIDRAEVGPDYLSGHAHADTLSFELSLFGQRVIVNSGTSVYGTGEQRQIERGTAAHSTVVIDGENSSEVWGGFRVARRARVFDRIQNEVDSVFKLSACHDGYRRLPGQPVHCREWVFGEGVMTVSDKITGSGVHEVVSMLPLHPEIGVVEVLENRALLNVTGHKVVVEVVGDGQLEVVTDFYHPEFGLSVENSKIMFKCNGQLPIKFIARVHW